MAIEVKGDAFARIPAHEHDRDAAGRHHGDAGIVRSSWRWNPRRSTKNDMVSARFWTATTTWSMRAATVSRPERLLSAPPIWVRRPAGLRHLDAMRLRQQDAQNELLCEVGIHAEVDRPLAPGGHHLADPGGLMTGVSLSSLKRATSSHTASRSETTDQLVVEFVDASPER